MYEEEKLRKRALKLAYFYIGLNYLFGIWQADPVAGILISLFLLKEGIETFKRKDVCYS